MATQKQIDANRRNAQKSTGPRTPEGKASVRLNAVRHGLRARTIVLNAEKEEEFQDLCAGLETAWRPIDQPEQIQVEAMAIAYWKLARLEREAAIFLQGLDLDKRLRCFSAYSQIQARLERAYSRAQHDLQMLQKTRAARGVEAPEPAAPQAVSPDPRPAPPPPAGPAYVMSPESEPAAAYASPSQAESMESPPGVY